VLDIALKSHNITTFLDAQDLEPGQPPRQTLEAALQAARVVVMVVPLSFLERKYPMRELDWLVSSGKLFKAVPVFNKLTRDECKAESLSATVQQALKMNNLARDADGCQRLLADLDALVHCGNMDFSDRSPRRCSMQQHDACRAQPVQL
jgi:hypothetical protein